MAEAPKPLSGRTPNIRIPPGKEHEYTTDAQGNIVHVQYGSDPEIPDANVLPSGRGGRLGSGGNFQGFDGKKLRPFDPLGRDLKQNIVLFDESGAPELVTKTNGHELAATTPKGPQLRDSSDSTELSAEEADQLGENAEYLYRGMAAMRSQGAAPVPAAPAPPTLAPEAAPAARHIEEGFVPAPKKASKMGKQTKKKAKKSRRVVKSEERSDPDAASAGKQEPNYLPVEVEINAPFGRLRQSFSGIFRDGGNLILYTDKRHVPLYTLPEVSEPLRLTVTWQDRVVPCVWAGIQFTLPHAPVTFTVLLIDEGQADGEGQSGEGWPNEV
jgi:hypothetical protein